VPDNAVGEACIAFLRQYGIDLSNVRSNGFRLGIYYVETGASQRASTFLYNRKGSSITELSPGDFDWPLIFEGKHWFHFSGITPALSDSVAAILLEACAAAKAAGLTVSADLNFRKKLWSAEKAREVWTELMKHVDVLFTNEEEAELIFGIKARGADVRAGRIEASGYEDVATQLIERFGLRCASITLRESISASVNDWSGLIADGSGCFRSRKYRIDPVVDRVGGGDAFSAGIIFGLLTGQGMQDTVEFAAAASCLKHSIHGDVLLAGFEEIADLIRGGGSGRIHR
jgi:2-dehydro-3-deoxygluconokinase